MSQGAVVGVCIRGISDIQCLSVHGVLGGGGLGGCLTSC